MYDNKLGVGVGLKTQGALDGDKLSTENICRYNDDDSFNYKSLSKAFIYFANSICCGIIRLDVCCVP